MIKLRIKESVFENANFTYSLTGAIKTIHLNDPELNVTVVGNFDITPQTTNLSFPHVGTWYDYLSKDSINVTGASFNLNMQPGEYHVYTSKNLNSAEVVDVELPEEIKKNGEYFFNYPNPVTDETNIAYNLMKSSQVTIKLFDFLGKELQTLVDRQQAAGQHQFNWNINSISKITTGVYFLRLESEGQTKVHKIIVAN